MQFLLFSYSDLSEFHFSNTTLAPRSQERSFDSSSSHLHDMKSHVSAGGFLFSLLAAKTALADDYLVSEKHSIYKRQNNQSKNITFLHVNDVHAHLDEYRSSGGFRSLLGSTLLRIRLNRLTLCILAVTFVCRNRLSP